MSLDDSDLLITDAEWQAALRAARLLREAARKFRDIGANVLACDREVDADALEGLARRATIGVRRDHPPDQSVLRQEAVTAGGQAMNVTLDLDAPCLAPGCVLLVHQHTSEQAHACAIAGLEQRILDLDRAYDDERKELIDGGAYYGQGQLNGSDRDRLAELEFERSMELAILRADLKELRSAGVLSTNQPESEAER